MNAELISSAAESIASNIEQIENIAQATYSVESLPVSQGIQFQLIQDALDSEFNSTLELEVKKLMSAALLIAKNKGLLPEGISPNIGTAEAVAIVDDAFTIIKAAYQVATNKIDIYEGADIIIDRATARALAASDMVVEKGIDFAINKVSKVVAKSCPPLIPLTVLIKYTQPWITEKAKPLVKEGILLLNRAAKASVRIAFEDTKKKNTNIIRRILLS